MTKWYTRHADMAQATTTYAALSLNTANATVASPKVPAGYGHISWITAVFGIDAAVGLDLSNIGVLKLSGDAMVHGDQELIIGAIESQETGTSVTEVMYISHPLVLGTNIWVKPGETLDLSAAYYGTDIGDPIMSVSIGLDEGRGGAPVQYRTRGDSHTSGTDAFEAVETKPDGSTGAFNIPVGARAVNRLLTLATINTNAATTIGGDPWVWSLGGDAVGQTAQEIVGYLVGMEAGAGTVTSTEIIAHLPAILPAGVPVTGGQNLDMQVAFKGVEVGTTQFVAGTLEII